MLNSKHLSLRMVRLKPAEDWIIDEGGLAFVFPKGGVGEFVSAAFTHRLVPGDVLVWNVESGGKLRVPAGGEMVFAKFSVAMESLFPLFGTDEICLLQNVTEGLKGASLHSASKSVAKTCHKLLEDVSSSSFNLDHRSQLLRVVGTILTEEFRKFRGDRAGFVRAEDHLVQVFESLSTDELLTLSVGALAGKFGCSRRHLSRLFQQHFGFSLAALKMEMRLLKAVSLLRDPNAKIINVAQESGFNHLGLFNTCFKKRFGSSPGQWRKMAPQAKSPEVLVQAERACPLRDDGVCPWAGTPVTSQSGIEITPAKNQKGLFPGPHKTVHAGFAANQTKAQGQGLRIKCKPPS